MNGYPVVFRASKCDPRVLSYEFQFLSCVISDSLCGESVYDTMKNHAHDGAKL